jgi:cytoskeletal protein RodZ
MNENEKNLFYSVLKEQITEKPTSESVSNIMHIISQKVHKKMIFRKILRVLGFVSLGIGIVGFLYVYLFWYHDFKIPEMNVSFVMPSRIYTIMISIVFVFSLIELYFRKRLYGRNS